MPRKQLSSLIDSAAEKALEAFANRFIPDVNSTDSDTPRPSWIPADYIVPAKDRKIMRKHGTPVTFPTDDPDVSFFKRNGKDIKIALPR